MIADHLKQPGVRFERWPVVDQLPAEPTSEEVLAAYADRVRRVVDAEGYVLVDAVHMTPADTPEWADKAASARQRFLAEHTHDDDEDRFFARGAGVFYLHVDRAVHAVLCDAGDLLSVPANTTHWFDMGTRPDYVAIRIFHDDDGWVGSFTGSDLAGSPTSTPSPSPVGSRAGRRSWLAAQRHRLDHIGSGRGIPRPAAKSSDRVARRR